MKTEIYNSYLEVLRNFPETDDFLSSRGVKTVEKLDSLWRKENLILRLNCDDGEFVLKIINNYEKEDEPKRVRMLSENYPSIMPRIFLFEKNSYLMEYISGDSFFNLKENKKIEKISQAGEKIRETYSTEKEKKDISEKIFASFQKYRESRNRFFSDYELRLEKDSFDIFKSVPDNPSHNDLNAANLLYTRNNIKFIDPSEEGYNDAARDVGRYCASCFFNNYDYFGQNKQYSLDIAAAFLFNFSNEVLARAKYYIGESFMSFLNFDTVSTPKEKLKKLAFNMLTKKQGIISILEESL